MIDLLPRFKHLSEGLALLPISSIVKLAYSWIFQDMHSLKDAEGFELKFCEMKPKILLQNFKRVVISVVLNTQLTFATLSLQRDGSNDGSQNKYLR